MLKKLIALTLALIISLSAATVFAYAESEESSPTETEQIPVQIKFVYVPLKSRIVIGNFGPLFAGTVIRATYPDGTSELLTVRKTDNGYIAGDYKVEWNFFFIEQGGIQPTIINYGINSGVFRIINDNDETSHYIGEELFNYLNLPSPTEIIFLIIFYAKIIGSALMYPVAG